MHSCNRGRGALCRPNTQTKGTLWTTQHLQAALWHAYKPRQSPQSRLCSYLWLAAPGCGLKLEEALLHRFINLHDGRHVTCNAGRAQYSASLRRSQTCQGGCCTQQAKQQPAVTTHEDPHHLLPASRGVDGI